MNSSGTMKRGVHAVSHVTSTGANLPRLKVAIIATHPIQYQAPLWRRLALQPDLQVKAFFGTDMSVRGYRDEGFGVSFKWDTPLLEGYEHEFISTDPRIQRVSFSQPGFGGVIGPLKAFSPQVVLLTAYRGLYHLGALTAARRLGARVVMRHEASDVAEARSPLKGKVRDWLLRRLYARVDRFAAIGMEARQHLLRVGVPAARIGSAPYCVDSDFMERQVVAWRPQRDRLRQAMGIAPPDLALVFSGKLIPKKNPLLLAAALALLPMALLARIHLIVAGDGELRAQLQWGLQKFLGPRLHLLGFLNQSEIGRAYATADVLVLPSRKGTGETWGLVVNEGMQFGLPAIVSDGVGCHVDLVGDNRTGWMFPSDDAPALARAIRSALDRGFDGRREMGGAARLQMTDFSIDAAACGLADALFVSAGRQGSGPMFSSPHRS